MAAQPGANLAAMRPETDDEALDRLLHPGRHYERPTDVLKDPALTPPEQRAILSSWAAGACAAESLPAFGRQVSFDEIMDALAQLDHTDRRRTPPRRSRDDPRGAGA